MAATFTYSSKVRKAGDEFEGRVMQGDADGGPMWCCESETFSTRDAAAGWSAMKARIYTAQMAEYLATRR